MKIIINPGKGGAKNGGDKSAGKRQEDVNVVALWLCSSLVCCYKKKEEENKRRDTRVFRGNCLN